MTRFGMFPSRGATRTNLYFLKFELMGIADGLECQVLSKE